MTKTNLRAYNREIETLIDQNNINEAITHCKYILKIFPKHVDTYRLLGKAYLESRHYSDAADLFLRVLSVIPDDFISQIGMSIIREDEANLDAAIWHMERAFESQPSNSAIQDELRRLYGRRDGVQPPKVRLTRGALVRMYARGELYPQAIAEAKVSLSEDPSRIDVEILQARMHYICNQKTEAAEVCNRIISRLPFCFEANQILFDILPENAQEERKVYQQRLFAINPYCAYMTPSHASVSLVPDAAVQLERLEYSGETQLEEQPEWAQTIGSDLSSTEEDLASDWLPNNAQQFVQSSDHTAPVINDVVTPFSETQAVTPAFGNSTESEEATPTLPIPTESDENDIIPDWMKSNGWVRSEGGVEQAEQAEGISGDVDAELEEANELEPAQAADLPEWLQNMAPAEVEAAPEETAVPNFPVQEEQEESADDLSWLTATNGAPVKEEEEDIPAWLAENLNINPQTQAPDLPESPAAEETSTPEFEAEAEPASSAAYTGTNLEADLAWFESLSANQGQADAAASLESETPESVAPTASQDEEEDLSFLQSLSASAAASELTESIESSVLNTEPQDEVPAWLSMAAQEETEIPQQEQADLQEQTSPVLLSDESTMPVEPSLADEGIPSFSEATSPLETAFEPQETQPVIPPSEVPVLDEVNTPESVPEWITTQSDLSDTLMEEPESIVESIPEAITGDSIQEEPTAEVEPVAEEMPVPQAEAETESPVTLPVERLMQPEEEISAEPEPVPQTVGTGNLKIDYKNLGATLAQINELIQSGQSLDEAITQLDELVYRNPINADIWQMLGDAHFKANHLQEAIEAYTKAEELIR